MADEGPPTLRLPQGDEREALVRNRFMATRPPPVVCHALAIRLAKLCGDKVRPFIPPESMEDVEWLFHDIIKKGLKEYHHARLEP